ncbi:MAG TPA: hypothetical protein DCZ20_01915 [Lachnospiraceae bacterium]|nr:hypothetical protein [Lachnospiraceae bacterium]
MADRVRVGPEGLAGAVVEALNEARDLTEEALKRAIDKTASQTVADTKQAAPVKTGAYKRGWRSKVTERLSGRGAYGKTVHNRTRYRLAHLLQHGHGGPRPARAYPHIPSDVETEALLTQNIEREMRKG